MLTEDRFKKVISNLFFNIPNHSAHIKLNNPQVNEVFVLTWQHTRPLYFSFVVTFNIKTFLCSEGTDFPL